MAVVFDSEDILYNYEQFLDKKANKLLETKQSGQNLTNVLETKRGHIAYLRKEILEQKVLLIEEEARLIFNEQKNTTLQKKKISSNDKLKESASKIELVKNKLNFDRERFCCTVFDNVKKFYQDDKGLTKMQVTIEFERHSQDLELLEKDVFKLNENIRNRKNTIQQIQDAKNKISEAECIRDDLIFQVEQETQKLDKCKSVKVHLNHLPSQDSEFQMMKAKLNNLRSTNKEKPREMTVTKSDLSKETKQRQKTQPNVCKRFKFMFKQRSLDEFWNVSK